MSQAVGNSSIFQPLINFVNCCEIETSNLFAALPRKDGEESRLANIVRRIAFVCSIILPVIGLIAMMFSQCCKPTPPNRANANPPLSRLPQPNRQAGAAAPQAPANAAANPQAQRNLPASQKVQAAITVPQLETTALLLSTITAESIVQNPETLVTYLELRAVVEKTNPSQLKSEKPKSIYDGLLQIINNLDIPANFSLEADGQPSLVALS